MQLEYEQKAWKTCQGRDYAIASIHTKDGDSIGDEGNGNSSHSEIPLTLTRMAKV